MRLLIDISADVYTNMVVKNEYTAMDVIAVHNALMGAVHIFGEKGQRFKSIVVEYYPENLCTYHKYKGKPYFSIMYEAWGEHIVGYGTYNPEVLSRYLIEHFMMQTVIKAAKEGRTGITVGEFLGAISDCRKSKRQKVIAEVLEILDEVSSDSNMGGEYWNAAKTVKVLRRRFMALKEGEHGQGSKKA